MKKIKSMFLLTIILLFATIVFLLGKLKHYYDLFPANKFMLCNNINSKTKELFNGIDFKVCTKVENFYERVVLMHEKENNAAHILLFNSRLQNHALFNIPYEKKDEIELENRMFKESGFYVGADIDYNFVYNKRIEKHMKRILVTRDIEYDGIIDLPDKKIRMIQGNFHQFGISTRDEGNKCAVELSFAYGVTHNGIVSIFEDKKTGVIYILVSFNRENKVLDRNDVVQFIDENPWELLDF